MIPGLSGILAGIGAVPYVPPPIGALVYENIADSSPNRTFNLEAYDDGGWWTSGSPSRLTVPAGVSLVRVVGQTTTSGSSTPACGHTKNGATAPGVAVHNGQDNIVPAVSAPIAVVASDYFEQQYGSGTTDATGGMWGAIESLDAATKYALVTKTATQALSAGVETAVIWDSETVDTDGWHDNVTNNTRMTVPSGVTRVRVCFGLRSTAFVNTPYYTYISKNGAPVAGGAIMGQFFGGRHNAASAILEVTAGDYFEVICRTTAGQTITTGDQVWMSIEEVPDYTRALVNKVATQSLTSGVTAAVAFGSGSEVYDTASIHDEITNNSYLTVPSGYTRARLCFSLECASATGVQKAWVRKNGSGTIPLIGLPGMDLNMTGAEYLTGFGAWVDVVAGDYFELMVTPGANQTLPVSSRTYFSIELA